MPFAHKAFSGFGEFVSGDLCRFCRGKAQCRARAQQNTALEDFKDFKAIPGSLADELIQIGHDHNVPDMPPVLTHDEIGDLLIRGKDLVAWFNDLQDYALKALLDGKEIPGWKAVAGRSNRVFSDQDAAIAAVISAGYDEALVYERKAKTLTELERLMGKAEFAEKIGEYVVKPLGKPTLAPLSDKREPYSSAASDFAGVTS